MYIYIYFCHCHSKVLQVWTIAKLKNNCNTMKNTTLGSLNFGVCFFFKDYTETFTTYSIWGLRFNPGLQWDKSSLLLMDQKFVTPHGITLANSGNGVWTQYLIDSYTTWRITPLSKWLVKGVSSAIYNWSNST